MKNIASIICLSTALAAFGCSGTPAKSTPVANPAKPQDKPEATTVKKPILGEADNTFSLSIPFESVTIVQGEEKAMVIGINRGDDFREEVSLEISDLPKGVTLQTVDPVIKHGSMDATLMLKAAKDAALGEFTVNLTGHTASSAADFKKEIKIAVEQP